MLYDTLKIVHILSATILLAGIVSSACLWLASAEMGEIFHALHAKTTSVIIPFALLQLLTGFTMISLKHYPLSDLWVKGSVLGFVIAILSWFAFLFTTRRELQKVFLSICLVVIGCMIFLMANKI